MAERGHEELAAAFERVAPMVAVGRPDEELPLVGARRLYLPPDDWQDTVLTLIREARLVVLVAGTRPGFLWELVRTLHQVPPQRVVLLVPMRAEEYTAFRASAERALHEHARTLREDGGEPWSPPALPDYADGEVFDEDLAIKSAVHFDPDWTPRFVRLDTWETARSLRFAARHARHPLRTAVEYGLRPVLDRARDEPR